MRVGNVPFACDGASRLPRLLLLFLLDALLLLLNAGVEPEACARDLIWICEHWDRVEEANALRFRFRPVSAEQMRLF